MSRLGRPVYKVWGNTLRFGNVAEERTERSWKYYKVDWVDDGAHEQAIQSMLSLRRDEYDSSHEWHRGDHINFFEPEDMIRRINMLEVK
tara:strand:+ start:258 stop:524 length:267 start_codon:yes stop_codon:yes gene_type:complete